MLHKVRDLPTETRGVVESLIGRPLRDVEAFSAAAGQLEQYFAEIDAQHPPV